MQWNGSIDIKGSSWTHKESLFLSIYKVLRVGPWRDGVVVDWMDRVGRGFELRIQDQAV